MKAVAKDFKTQHLVAWDSRLDEGLTLIGAEPPIDKEAIQDAIESCLAKLRRNEDFSKISNKPATALGTIWGWTITSAFQWKWKVLEISTDEGEYDRVCLGICDPEMRYMYSPEELFPRMVDHPEIPGPKQRFAAIKSGNLPSAVPGALVDLGQQ